MSGMQMPPDAGGQKPPDGQNPIERNKSVFNPADMASMVSSGQVQKGMSVKDLIENVFKVPIDAPASALAEAVKKHAQNKSVLGKTQSMAQQAGGPPRGPRPEGQPPQGPPPQRGEQPAARRQGLDDLFSN